MTHERPRPWTDLSPGTPHYAILARATRNACHQPRGHGGRPVRHPCVDDDREAPHGMGGLHRTPHHQTGGAGGGQSGSSWKRWL